MQIIGFLVIGFVILLAIIGASSEHDEHRNVENNPNDDRNYRGGQNYYHNPNYPPWGAPPDWHDSQYDYYRRPRMYRFQSVVMAHVRGALMTFFAVCLVLFIIYLKREPKSHGRYQPEVKLSSSSVLEGKQSETQVNAKPTEKVPTLEGYLDAAKSSSPVNYLTLLEAQKACADIEIYQTRDKRCFAFLIGDSRKLDKFVQFWRKEYKAEFNFDFTPYQISKFCEEGHQSYLVKDKKSEAWVCPRCKE